MLVQFGDFILYGIWGFCSSLWKASKFRLWKERSLFVKVWCLVGGYVVPTPSLFIKTSRRDIISRWKNTKSFYCSLYCLTHSYYYMYTNPCHPEFVIAVREQKTDAQVHLLWHSVRILILVQCNSYFLFSSFSYFSMVPYWVSTLLNFGYHTPVWWFRYSFSRIIKLVHKKSSKSIILFHIVLSSKYIINALICTSCKFNYISPMYVSISPTIAAASNHKIWFSQ